jgi:hypothetical protein
MFTLIRPEIGHALSRYWNLSPGYTGWFIIYLKLNELYVKLSM